MVGIQVGLDGTEINTDNLLHYVSLIVRILDSCGIALLSQDEHRQSQLPKHQFLSLHLKRAAQAYRVQVD
jgi:hypothetical protein